MCKQQLFDEYIKLLHEELISSCGCTEPAALAYAGSVLKNTLGAVPDKIIAVCSRDIIKNVRCVSIPNAEVLKGVKAAVVLGVVGGIPDRKLDVLAEVTKEHIAQTQQLLENGICDVIQSDEDVTFLIRLNGIHGNDEAIVEIRHTHTNLTLVSKNGEVFFNRTCQAVERPAVIDAKKYLSVDEIYDFAEKVDIEKLIPLLDTQINANMNIAAEGLKCSLDVGVGRTILEREPGSIFEKVRAYAAAGSEARMSGSMLPVIINSGSGNQGITCSVPVIVYGREKGYDSEHIYRALAFSNLLTIHQKTYVGTLSAYCGAICAACAAGAAIAYMDGASLDQIKMVITNTLATVSGIICDGAKASCASKIAAALDTAFTAYHLAMKNSVFAKHDGIVQDDVEKTIGVLNCISRSMKELDYELVGIMEC